MDKASGATSTAPLGPAPAPAPADAQLLSRAAFAAFLRRQERDWRVTVARTSLDRLASQMIFPYLSVYIVALGASATQLGLVNSLAMLISGLAGPFVGWLIDRHGPRPFYLAGIGLLAVSYLTYALAQSWVITIAAMTVYWLGYSISGHSCATICGNCLANQDRATGMTVCETVGGGLVGIVGPLLGALIVSSSATIDPYRPFRHPSALRHRLRHHAGHVRARVHAAVASPLGDPRSGTCFRP